MQVNPSDDKGYRNNSKVIFGWAMYDWANSAYITIFGAIVAAFFASEIMTNDTHWGLSAEALWSIFIGLGSIVLLLAMPILGAIADYTNGKRRFLRNFAIVGALFTMLISLVPGGQVSLFLFVLVVSQFGFVAANVFYDGYLPEIASDDTIDQVSSKGFALGYLGGGIYLAFALVLILTSSDQASAIRIAIFGSGVWWLLFSVVSLVRLPPDSAILKKKSLREYTSIGFSRTMATTRKLREFPQLLRFIVAFVIYNSGTGTVIAVSGVYAIETLELDVTMVAMAFLIVQFVAFFGAFLLGALARRIGPKTAVMMTLVVWVGVAVGAYFLPVGASLGFLGLAGVIGFVLGGVQALSRSLYGTMIPEEASAEFFGFYSVFSKMSGFGPLIFGIVAAVSGSGRAAILSVALFFIVGLILLARVDIDEARASRDRWDFATTDG